MKISNLKAHIALLLANIIYVLNYGWAKDVMGGGFVKPFAFILMKTERGAEGACRVSVKYH